MTDPPGSKMFDMPHARVTLTPVGPNVEIEVWPKQGQSAYAVVDPTVAVLIARHLVELAAAQLAAAQVAGVPVSEEEATGFADVVDPGPMPDPEPSPPANVVDLASRRRSPRPEAG